VKTILLVTRNINKINHGLTQALYYRANSFAERGYEVFLFTISPSDDFLQLVEDHYEAGNLNRNVKVFNMFLSNLDGDTTRVKLHTTKYAERIKDGLTRFPDKDNPYSYRCFKGGVYTMYERYNEDLDLRSVDYFKAPWIRTKREIYRAGVRVRTTYMDEKLNRPNRHVHYHQDGTPSVTRIVNPLTRVEKKYTYHDLDCEKSDIYELGVVWIQQMTKNIEEPVLFIDSLHTANALIGYEAPNVKKVFVLHASHLATPYKNKNKVSAQYNPIFGNVDKLAKFVCLTEDTKEDIVDQFGEPDKFVVIPHFQDQVTLDDQIQKEEGLVVSLARYCHQKNLSDSIKAFKKVAREVPNAKYELYGYGPEEQKLRNLINRYRLQDRVFIKNYAEDPSVALQRAELTVLSSVYEGFGLAIVESFAYGVPVVSYDCKYGPAEIIRDDVDGLIVPTHDVDRLAQAMTTLLKDKAKLAQMAQHTSDVFERFDKAKIEKQWLDLLEKL